MGLHTSEINQHTEIIWKSILGLDVIPTQEDFQTSEKDNTLSGCVHISGSWDGTVALLCPVQLARKAAAIMFGLDEDKASLMEIQDALGELANMTGGNLKSLLPEPCYLSLPVVAITPNLRFPGSEIIIESGFKCGGHHFKVTVLKRVKKTP